MFKKYTRILKEKIDSEIKERVLTNIYQHLQKWINRKTKFNI